MQINYEIMSGMKVVYAVILDFFVEFWKTVFVDIGKLWGYNENILKL